MANAEFESAVQAEASARAYLARCDDVRARGIEKYGDKFKQAMTEFAERGGLDDPTLRTILDGADDPAAAVMAFAANPEEHQRILDLRGPSRSMAALKLAAKATRTGGGENPSTPAEKPDPRSSATLYDKQLSDEDWYRIRGEQKRDRRRI